MTNYEKIKSMTATELAEFLKTRTMCPCCNLYFKGCGRKKNACRKAHLKWLESEAEGHA